MRVGWGSPRVASDLFKWLNETGVVGCFGHNGGAKVGFFGFCRRLRIGHLNRGVRHVSHLCFSVEAVLRGFRKPQSHAETAVSQPTRQAWSQLVSTGFLASQTPIDRGGARFASQLTSPQSTLDRTDEGCQDQQGSQGGNRHDDQTWLSGQHRERDDARDGKTWRQPPRRATQRGPRQP